MKKLLGLIAGLMMAASALPAAGDTSDKWLLQGAGGLCFPVSGQAASQWSLGFSGEAQAGFAFSREFFLSLESGLEFLPVNSSYLPAHDTGTLIHIPLEAVAQYNFNAGGGVWPFLLLGAGVAFDDLSFSAYTFPPGAATNWTNFELDPGIGVAFDVTEDVNIFVQGKVEMDFEPAAEANAEFQDKPLIAIPIQVGVNFLL
jgi:opacity protein-like surface antigen